MNQLSTCCLANPTHSCTQLISSDHYHPRLWPKLDAAWLIMQPAANYLAAARHRTRRLRQNLLPPPSAGLVTETCSERGDQAEWFHLKSEAGSSNETERNEDECETQPDSTKPRPQNTPGGEEGKTQGVMLGLIFIWWKLFPSFT